MNNEFVWSKDLLNDLTSLLPILNINSDESSQLAYAALRSIPVTEDANQQLILNLMRELIIQSIDKWTNYKKLSIDDSDLEQDYALLTLQALKKQRHLKAKYFSNLLGSKTLVSLIFSGKRQLTREHIDLLCQHFQISPALFFKPVVSVTAIDKPDYIEDLEMELRQYMSRHVKQGRNKSRNTEMVCFYYGFSKIFHVTLERLSEQFNFSNRERPRQILFDCLQNKADIRFFPILKQVADLLTQTAMIRWLDFKDMLLKKGLLEGHLQVWGFLKYLHLFGLCQDFSLYTLNLKKVQKKIRIPKKNLWLISHTVLSENKHWIKQMYRACGRVGLGCFEELWLSCKMDKVQQNIAKVLIDNSEFSWHSSFYDKTWYIFANRDNRLLNDLSKIFNVIDKATPEQLAVCLNNGINNRKQRFEIPPIKVIAEYLKNCHLCDFDGQFVRYKGELSTLTPIQKDVVAWLQKKTVPSDFAPLREHLAALGYSKPNIDKNIGKSSLVYVDKSGGRAHYTYCLVGRGITIDN